MIPVTYNIRNLVVRKTTTIAAVFGIALVTFMFAGIFMLQHGIQQTLSTSGRPDNAIVMRMGSDAELSSSVAGDQIGLIKARDSVIKDAAGTGLGVGEVVVVVTATRRGSDGEVSNVQVRGVPENVWDFRPEAQIIAGRKPKAGTDEVAIGKSIRGRFEGMELDETFPLKRSRPVKVVGIFAAGGASFESEVWADVDTVRATFGRQGGVSSVRVRLSSASKFDAFKADIESDKNLGLQAQREIDYYEAQSEGTAAFIVGIGIVIAVFFALGAIIGAAITMYAQVSNRNREIGTLRALGFSRSAVLTSFVIESLMVATVGGIVGVAASLLMSLKSFSMLNMASWSEIVFRFETTPKIMVMSMIFALVMGFLGGLLPAARAAKLSPLAAIRG